MTGTPFIFPAGISMSSAVRTDMSSCTSSSFYECVTDGDLPYYMSLHNSNNTATMVIFPAGIVIPGSDTAYQGGVIVQPDTVIVPPSTSICVNLNAFCLNHHRTFSYAMNCGNMLVTDNDNLTPLIMLLSHKKPVAYDNNGALQNAVWNIGDSTRLTQQDIDAINLLP